MVRRGSNPLSPSDVLTAASPCADKETRDKAVKTLTRYLKSGPVLEELDLAKIWKALFYCMWHADKPKVQNELAERLGDAAGERVGAEREHLKVGQLADLRGDGP